MEEFTKLYQAICVGLMSGLLVMCVIMVFAAAFKIVFGG